MSPLNSRQSWIVDTFGGVGRLLGDAFHDSTTGTSDWVIDKFANLPSIPAGLAEFWGDVANPDSITARVVRTMGDAAGFLIACGRAGMIASELGVQAMHAAFPHSIPGVGEINHLRQWFAYDETEHLQLMAFHGFNSIRGTSMYNASLPKPGLGEILAGFVKRHGQVFTTEHQTTEYPWADDWLPTDVSANLDFPSVAQSVTLRARKHITIPQYNDLLTRRNYDSTMVQFIPSAAMQRNERESHIENWKLNIRYWIFL